MGEEEMGRRMMYQYSISRSRMAGIEDAERRETIREREEQERWSEWPEHYKKAKMKVGQEFIFKWKRKPLDARFYSKLKIDSKEDAEEIKKIFYIVDLITLEDLISYGKDYIAQVISESIKSYLEDTKLSFGESFLRALRAQKYGYYGGYKYITETDKIESRDFLTQWYFESVDAIKKRESTELSDKTRSCEEDIKKCIYGI